MTKLVDLSGRWTGVYFYPFDPIENPFDDLPPVPFTAELSDVAGAVSGTAAEPDLLYDAAAVIPSIIDGWHDGRTLRFVKFSEAAEGFEHPIHYDGAISSDGLSVDGHWSIPSAWSGTFQMQRRAAPAAASIKQSAIADGRP
ncbi:hypothetical protein [Brevundimonas lenta]|uniref:Uncharacterized protein n=1 Tax=Brevundimonas lenta TaxID=424796 RepID=A0A7W6NQV5_9CAUL|nr:hypothetical protein [Brevundimonas lenta]MBB4083525.1 hypothetical protein [Brevundimonas lenta]